MRASLFDKLYQHIDISAGTQAKAPEDPVSNGFDWEFDNTHPYEYDSVCASMDFYKITNGWMTNCYPENVFLRDTQQLVDILKAIKDL